MNENEVKIIKLPTIGEPFSYKTRKQGRTYSIANDIVATNKLERNKLYKISKYESANKQFTDQDVEKFLNDYKGSNLFINSIRKQARTKGFKKLSPDQINAIKRTMSRMI